MRQGETLDLFPKESSVCFTGHQDGKTQGERLYGKPRPGEDHRRLRTGAKARVPAARCGGVDLRRRAAPPRTARQCYCSCDQPPSSSSSSSSPDSHFRVRVFHAPTSKPMSTQRLDSTTRTFREEACEVPPNEKSLLKALPTVQSSIPCILVEIRSPVGLHWECDCQSWLPPSCEATVKDGGQAHDNGTPRGGCHTGAMASLTEGCLSFRLLTSPLLAAGSDAARLRQPDELRVDETQHYAEGLGGVLGGVVSLDSHHNAQ
ncbi:unnamed protein product [Pleuronectes platessa]|uniref:Uncharacterized protein n=1 Tax=Pleuronectes platessa TaxID=8262 RepID=A0A9N7YJU9_PLEPL|nr:unnamed protein product [Pleuronectes platessa]